MIYKEYIYNGIIYDTSMFSREQFMPCHIRNFGCDEKLLSLTYHGFYIYVKTTLLHHFYDEIFLVMFGNEHNNRNKFTLSPKINRFSGKELSYIELKNESKLPGVYRTILHMSDGKELHLCDFYNDGEDTKNFVVLAKTVCEESEKNYFYVYDFLRYEEF